MASNSYTPATNVASYTALREAAKNLLNYVSFSSMKEQNDATVAIETLLAEPNDSVESAIRENLLGNGEAVPDNAKLISMLKSAAAGGDLTDEEASAPSIYFLDGQVVPLDSTKTDRLFTDRTIGVMFHSAKTRVDFASTVSDISAMFCNIVPSVEMSLCVPFFDVRIFYPGELNGLGKLNPLRFIGIGTKQAESFDQSSTPDTNLIGVDVAGTEIFCMPQTLVGQSSQINDPELVKLRGLEALDPLMPLMTLESANVQQIGVGGSLYAQTKVDLKLVLHDRSRLSDIEPLVSVEVFPTVTFRIEFGWVHPDGNNITGGAYAKLLNKMRIRQDFSLYSVSVGTRDATSLNISVSLISKGDYIARSASIISANSEYIPYSAVLTLVKQFVSVQSSKSDDQKSSVTFKPANVGSSIIASTSDGLTSNKYVSISSYYDLYNKINDIIKDEKSDTAELASISEALTALDINGSETLGQDYLSNLFNLYPQGQSVDPTYGANTLPFSLGSVENPVGISQYTREKIDSLAQGSMLVASDSTQRATYSEIVPLASIIAKVVVKPILLSDPTISEARIHCFSFNSQAGIMAEENIGSFPIIVRDLMEREEGGKKISGINIRSSALSALNKVMTQVNDPGSRFYGFSKEVDDLNNAVSKAKENPSETEEDRKAIEEAIQTARDIAEQQIEKKNSDYQTEKKLSGNDVAYIPPRIKYQMDVVPAYSDKPTDVPKKSILRLIVYDDRSGNFSKLGNFVSGMMNTNGIGQVKGAAPSNPINFLETMVSSGGDDANYTSYKIKDLKTARELFSKIYPTLTVGTEGSFIESATFNSQPSGEVASSYLLTAMGGETGGSVTGDTTASQAIDDVIIVPSTISMNMIGNPCMARGQTYYVDFGTGTTVDNTYSVQSVSHAIRPGSFKTSVTMLPVSSATMRSTTRQINELIKIVQKVQSSKALK